MYLNAKQRGMVMSRSIFAIALVLLLSFPIYAQEPPADRETRIKQLETQVQAILVELQKLKSESPVSDRGGSKADRNETGRHR